MTSLFQELKRRRVFRVAAVYAVVGWLLVQIAAVTFPALRLPPWAITLVLALVILGFPVALVLTWAFEITPDGVRRTGPAEETPTRRARALGLAAIGAVVAASVLAFARWGPGGGEPAQPAAATADVDPAERSEPRARTIAVLPFDNLSGDPADQWFSDGITEDVLTALSKVDDLHVISRTSSMAYRETDKTLRQIAGELGVGTILEGSVRRQGDRIRITAQLIDAATDRHLWAETFDRDAVDLFAVQTEIAAAIAEALEAELTPLERARILAGGTADLGAYELYLKGRDELNRGANREPVERAIAFFQEALTLDPDYALAHAGLARAYARRQMWLGVAWGDSALLAGTRAISLDPEAAEGYESLADAQAFWGLEDLAHENYRRALARNPNSPEAARGLGDILVSQGRSVEALSWIQRAARLEPTVPMAQGQVGDLYLELGMLEEARRWFERRRDLAPEEPDSYLNFYWLHFVEDDREGMDAALERARRVDRDSLSTLLVVGLDAMHQGRYADAAAALERWHGSRSDQWDARGVLGFAYRLQGKEEKAEAALRQAEEMALLWIARGDQGSWHWSVLVEVETARGNLDAAAAALERAIAGGDPVLLEFVRRWPAYEPLRRVPRVRQMIAERDAAIARMRERVEREGAGLRPRG